MGQRNNKLQDAINANPGLEYTQIPNHLLRSPDLTLKAKGILNLLLSNKEGWTSYKKTLLQFMKEGNSCLENSLIELEEYGYLLRCKYRDIHTKRFIGGFWAYTTILNSFNIESHLSKLEEYEYELTPESMVKYRGMYSGMTRTRFSNRGKPNANNINNNSFIKKNENRVIKFPFPESDFIKEWNHYKEYRWIEFKKEWRSTMGEKIALTKLKNLSKNNKKIAIKIIQQTTAEGWIGLFELKTNTFKNNGHSNKSAESKGTQISPIDIIRKRTDGYYRVVKKTHDQLFDNTAHNFVDKIEFSPSDGAVALCNLEDGIKAIRKDKRKIVAKYNKEIKSPSIIVSDYVWWLKQQDWLDNISVKLFTSEHKLFKRFVKQESNSTGRSIITGGYN